MVTLALIPARGGSKGVPRKNLRSVGDRTLLARAIDSARGAPSVDHILVSTDDEEIAAEARRCGAEVPFLRPARLAADEAAIGPAVVQALAAFEHWAGIGIDTLVLLEPTSPFRTAKHVEEALAKFRCGGFRSVVSVCPLERKPENIFRKGGDLLDRFIKEPRIDFTRRQAMSSLCRLNSAIYVTGKQDFVDSGSLLSEPMGFVEMTGVESINIDEELDLMVANAAASRFGL